MTVNAMDLNSMNPSQVISSTAMLYTVLPLAVNDSYQVTGGDV